MRRLRREFAPLIGYAAFVAIISIALSSAILYDAEYIDLVGLILPVLALPWGFLSFAFTEIPLLWVITVVGGIVLNIWLLWRDGRARVARAVATGGHHGAAD